MQMSKMNDDLERKLGYFWNGCYKKYHLIICGYLIPLTAPPLNELVTWDLKRDGFSRSSLAASWLSGSFGLGSMKRKIRPKMTGFTPSTGFQSARKMLRQTLPSVSMFGW